jgi:cell wall assembly regulator SMI1
MNTMNLPAQPSPGLFQRKPLRRALRNWLERHRHPVNFWIHLVGIPLAVAGVVLILLLPSAWPWAVAAFVLGYVLQWIGHCVEGNDVGEWAAIKRLLGWPYVGIASHSAGASVNSSEIRSEDISRIKTALSRLELWLAAHRRRFLDGLRAGASRAELDELDRQLGFAAPPELRLLLGWHNGQSEDFVGKFEEDWQLMSSAAIAAASQELEASTSGWQKGWLPFLDNDAGDYRFLDTTVTPAPVREFWLGKSEHKIVASSLTAWLEVFVDHVEKGDYREDPERGTFMH